MIKILPSIASANQLNLQEEIDKIRGTSYLHIDIEDGNFVPNITFGLKTIKSICKYSTEFIKDAHLLVTNPLLYIDDLLELNFEAIAIHYESMDYPLVALNKIRKKRAKAGLVLNFKTDVNDVLAFVDSLDYILIMCAEPDDNGEKYNSQIINKIKKAREILPKKIHIFVDGGINESNIEEVVSAGADTVVLGRAIWQNVNPLNRIINFTNQFKEVE